MTADHTTHHGPERTDRDAERRAEWSRLHQGIDPATVPLLTPWLAGVWWLARPLRAVAPTTVTASGAVLAVAAVPVASPYPAAALVLVVLATLCDALDGAVALLGGRATAHGAVADKVADRIADTAFALVVWQAGAPWWLAAAAGTLSLGHELAREVVGGARRARITVAERPTRVVCTVLACGAAAVTSANWPVTVCAAVWAGLAVIGLAQLARP